MAPILQIIKIGYCACMKAGFSVVPYSGIASLDRLVGHNLA